MQKSIIHIFYQNTDSPKGPPDGIKEKPTRLMLQYEKDGKPQIMLLTPQEEIDYKKALPQIEQQVSGIFKFPYPEDKAMEDGMRRDVGKKGLLNGEQIRSIALNSPELAGLREILLAVSNGTLTDNQWEAFKKLPKGLEGKKQKQDELLNFLLSVLVDSRKKGLPIFDYINSILGTRITKDTPIITDKGTISFEEYVKMKTIKGLQEDIIARKLVAQEGLSDLRGEIRKK